MSTEPDSTRPTDPGLEVLVTLLHLQGVAADAAQIAHWLGTDRIGASDAPVRQRAQGACLPD